MNKTGLISVLSVLIVLTGFTLFYFLKIVPAQDDLAYSKKNIAMYKEAVALKQKQLNQQKNALAEKKKQAKEEELLGQKVDQSILPKDPRIEAFFSAAQKKAASMDISFVSIVKSNTDSGNSSSSDASSSKGTSDSSSSSSASKQATQINTDPNKLLNANTYQITLKSFTNAQLYAYIGYLETQKRLLVIDKVSSTRTSNRSTASESAAASSAGDSSSAAQKQPSTVQANVDGSDNQTIAPDSNQTVAQARNSGISSSSDALEPSAQMVLTITLYSAKN